MLGVSVRALSFGPIAEAYERYRPGYPSELFDLVMTYADRPIRTALEIGAGTGKATRLFAQPGIAVTATDPDADMLAELRKHVPNVRAVQAAFEDLPLDQSYALVYAGAALHWTRPEGRWNRMAALVEPGGTIVSFGGPIQPADPAVEAAAQQARARFVDREDLPSPDGTAPDHEMQWPGTELQRSPYFDDVRQSTITRRLTISARDYVAYLSTVSAYLTLPPTARDEAYQHILQALPAQFELNADIIVHLARRC
ncbi:class I SAM-dependent methyltransferase [Actinoplanes sp. HUAS TT8]|uniref:class I SAM-dependent methyltransferase n=1 Tax=Actinoplanes sp. HUAS TT8 TaxID=3447453 RepID=UPI003F524D6E